MKISINAPSYRRPYGVKTLKYLPYCRVWVDCGEYEEYKKANPEAEIISCPKGVQGNVARIRNYILKKEFERGMDAVLMLDDDLSFVARFEEDPVTHFGYKERIITAEELPLIVEKYSIMAQDLGAKFWGVNCVRDARAYLQNVPFSTNRFIGGPFQCFLKGNRCLYDERLPLKEDYDMLLQQLNLERVVLRVNYMHFYCEQSTNVGGCAAYRNRQREAEQLSLLRQKWGGRIVHFDAGSNPRREVVRNYDDYNPIIKTPIRGV